MRIAILCAGRLANDGASDDIFTKYHKSVMENVVQDNEADFFVSHSPELGENVELFKELYKPKIFNNEPFSYVDTSSYMTRHIRHTTMCMFYNRARVFHDFEKYMRNTGEKYDLVLNHRLDVL